MTITTNITTAMLIKKDKLMFQTYTKKREMQNIGLLSRWGY
jgi:hypothetical protein